MKLYGSIKELVAAVFRKDTREITLRPNQTTTYSAACDIQLPAQDSDAVLVSRNSSDILTNKTIDGDDNTLQDIGLSSLKTVLADANEAILRDGAGAVVSAKITKDNIDSAAGILDTQLATISTAGKVSNSATTASSSAGNNTIVSRDSSGNFAANTITATLSGNASNITATTNSTITTLSALSLPGSQVSGNISGNAANVTGIVAGVNGGTGVANSGKTITLGGNLTTSGAFATTLTATNTTSVTLPTSGTLATLANNEALLNKTISSTAALTGALTLPVGTTSDRSGLTTQGMVRYNTTDASFEGYDGTTWSGLGGGGTTDRVTQASHGFAVGDVLYLNGSTYAKAVATAANTAEVIGMVSRVLDSSTFELTLSGEVKGLSGLTVGEVYFLSPSVAGGITVTEPNVIGQVSAPIGVASSTTSLYVAPKRGNVIGGTNARTQIPLSAVTTAQTVYTAPAGLDAGELTGWVYLDATADSKFYVSAPFAKNGAGSDWNISPAYVGDTPPAGFSMGMTSGGLIQITMNPLPAGFVSGYINYALNAPAVGATFPLAVDAGTITTGTVAAARLPVVVPGTSAGVVAAAGLPGNTTGNAIASGYVGQFVGTENIGTGGSGYSSGSTTIATTTLSSLISLTLDKGIYLIGIFVRQTKAANANADRVYGNIQIGGTTVHSANIIQSTSTSSSGGTMSLSVTMPIKVSTDGTVVRFWGGTAIDAATAGDNLMYSIRIA